MGYDEGPLRGRQPTSVAVQLGYHFRGMDISAARTIADLWSYPPPYDFYDMTSDPDDYDEFVDPHRWSDGWFQVCRGEELVGFLIAEDRDDTVDIGLGLRPDLTGQGVGEMFVEACLRQAASSVPGARAATLSVATFNQRAIAVYIKSGFLRGETRLQNTNGGQYPFLDMVLPIGPTLRQCP